MKNSAFSLLEILIVLIILATLASIGYINYSGVRQSALDREAEGNLELIIAAERIYFMEYGQYYDSAGASVPEEIGNINSFLKLAIQSGGNLNWQYKTEVYGPAPFSACAQATNSQDVTDTWSMQNTDTEPVEGGSCP
ncbi:MAG: prepilin-type N-terminal cleavage/methylation domain-containing protein [Candidatus Omnitrophota bacterium]